MVGASRLVGEDKRLKRAKNEVRGLDCFSERDGADPPAPQRSREAAPFKPVGSSAGLAHQLVVVSMRAYPEPNDAVRHSFRIDADHTVVHADPGRPETAHLTSAATSRAAGRL
jgi:hypothetical protein